MALRILRKSVDVSEEKGSGQNTENPWNEYNVVFMISPDEDRFQVLINPDYVSFNGSF